MLPYKITKSRPGTKLADHPLAKQFEACNSVTSFLRDRAQAFHESRGADGKCMRSLKCVVYVLAYPPLPDAALSQTIGLVVPSQE